MMVVAKYTKPHVARECKKYCRNVSPKLALYHEKRCFFHPEKPHEMIVSIELAADPEVYLRGIPEVDAGGTAMHEVAGAALLETFDSLPKARRRDPESVAEAVTRGVRAAIAYRWGKKPNVYVHVLVV